MIVDLLLGIGRFIDRLLGHERPARSSLAAWRIPLQLPGGEGPWSFDPPEAPPDLIGMGDKSQPKMLSTQEAADLAEEDALVQRARDALASSRLRNGVVFVPPIRTSPSPTPDSG